MGHVNLGSMLMGTVSGNHLSGNTQSTSSTKASESFDKTFDRARDSSRTKEASSRTKSTNRREDSAREVKQDEKPYEKKEVTDKEVTKKSETTSKEVDDKEITEVGEEREASNNQSIDEQILALVSQTLNVSIDEIKVALSQLGLEAKDLMNQEEFSAFIGEICGQGSVAELLMNAEDIKSITALFEQLSAMNEGAQSVIEENTTNQTMLTASYENGLMESVTENSLITKSQEQVVATLKTDEAHQTILNEEGVIAPIKPTDRYSENAKTSDQNLSFLQGQEQQTEDIGIHVPVHNFTTTAFTQFFETEGGTVTQMTTIQSSENGEAFIKQIDFKVLGQTRELNVQLSPKELGNLNIKITENNGALVAEIKVDNPKAKEFILNEIHLLKESLESQGLNVADVKVDIRQDNHQAQMEQERQKSSKRIQEIISKHFAEDEQEEQEVASIAGESEVDYMV